MGNVENDKKLVIFRYLLNQASEEEIHGLLDWLKQSDENRKFFLEYRKLFDLSLNTDYKVKFSETRSDSWKRLNKKIKNESSGKKKQIPFYLKIAAALIIFFAGALTFYCLFGSKSNPDLGKIEYEVNAPRGGKSEVVLADGTKVWLNAGTRLRYQGDYGIHNRIVNLSGEGFFVVVKNPQKPFIVQASGMKIKAFGTSFNVKAYPEEKSVTTTLVEGIVKIEVAGVHLSLKPKDVVVIDKDVFKNASHAHSAGRVSSEKINPDQNEKDSKSTANLSSNITVATNVNTNIYTSWKDNLWIINSEPLKNIAVILERKFNVKIDIRSSELNKYTFTGTFNNETLEQILDIIKLTAPLNYKINKGVIIITAEQKRKATYNNLIK